MADEFPGAFRNDRGDSAEEFFVQSAGDDDAERAVWSCKVLSLHRVVELGGKRAEDSHLGIARPESGARQQFTGLQRLTRAERITNCVHTASSSRAQQGPQY